MAGWLERQRALASAAELHFRWAMSALADSENLPHTRKQDALIGGVTAMTIAVVEKRIRILFERVETVEDVAETLSRLG